MNTVQLVGRIGSVFKEERFTRANGDELLKLRFLMAVKRPLKAVDGEEVKPDWVRVEVWGATAASLMAHNAKGSRIGVTGRIHGDLYQPEGAPYPDLRMSVVAERIDFLSSRPREDNGAAPEEPEEEPVAASNGKAAASAERKR
ncbi:MAG: single-stranded DNA-binding protein [Candidatus Dormibacteria bacterium]